MTSARLPFRFRSFLLLFGEAMLVRVGGVVWERAAGRMFCVCVDLFSKIKAYVDFIMLELLIFCATSADFLLLILPTVRAWFCILIKRM